MAETSLARQLKKLAAPQTSLLLKDKFQASLLFDPKEASGIDRETFFAIGTTGLDELQAIQSSFAQFEHTLFNTSSKTLERAVLTAEENAKLDAVIDRFLRMLTPYFLLRPAHKALEWLIHRFHIQNYNVDSLMACILPYHETRLFVRALQLFDLRNPAGKWHWLHPLQKPGLPLPKSVLLNHCYKDLGFLKFICNLVPNLLKVYEKGPASVLRTVVSFSTMTIIGALEYASSVTEKHISSLMPHIISGIKSPVTDYCAGMYMVICQLFRRTNIVASVSKVLMSTIAMNLKQELLLEGISCMLIICQQHRMDAFSREILEALFKFPQFPETLTAIREKCGSVSCLLHPVLKGAIPLVEGNPTDATGEEEEEELPSRPLEWVQSLIRDVSFDEKDVHCAIKTVLDTCFAKPHDSGIRANLSSLLKRLERRFPSHFDWSVKQCYNQSKGDGQKALDDLLNVTLPDSKYQMLPECNTVTFLAVNHADRVVRSLAMKKLISSICEDKEVDAQFVQDTISARLHDDDPSIITMVLSLGKDLMRFLPAEDLLDALQPLLERKLREQKEKEWLPVKHAALQLVCTEELFPPINEHSLTSFLQVVLPHLLPLTEETMVLTMAILASPPAKLSPFLKGISQDEAEDHVKMCQHVILSLANNMLVLAKEGQEELVTSAFEQKGSYQSTTSFLQLCVFHKLLPELTNRPLALTCANAALTLCKNMLSMGKVRTLPESNVDDLSGVLDCGLRLIRKGWIPCQVVKLTLRSVLEAIKIPEIFEGSPCWLPLSFSTADDPCHLAFAAFDLMAEKASHKEQDLGSKGAPIFQALMTEFFEVHLKQRPFRLRFLCSLWMLSSSLDEVKASWATPVLQARALNVGRVMLRGQPLSKEELDIVLPSALVAAMSPLEPIRQLALCCLQEVSSTCRDSLVEAILQHKDEIQVDAEQLPQCVSTWSETNPAQANCILAAFLATINEPCTPCYVKHGLLNALRRTNSPDILRGLCPLLNSELANSQQGALDAGAVSCIEHALSKFTPETASLVGTDQNVTQTLKKVLLSELRSDGTSVQKIALGVVTKEFFLALPTESVKLEILQVLLDLCIGTDATSLARSVVRKISSDGCLIAKVFQQIEDSQPKTMIKELRRTKLKRTDPILDPEDPHWKRIVALLEVLENKKSIEGLEDLVQACFRILKRSLEMAPSPSSEYLRQVILSCLLNLVSRAEQGQLGTQHFRIETVVQCIRVSQNPQTHNLALLLLNVAASLFPEQILHHAMAIFTFMGTNLVKQDDMYSLQVILQTVQTIVPALLKKSDEEDGSLEMASSVTLVFVDALPDIPQHRRLPLFSTLVSTLGVHKYLWLCLVQIIDRCILHRADADVEGLPPLADFAIQLLHTFDPDIQVTSLLKMIEFLVHLPSKSQTDGCKKGKDIPKKLFDVDRHTEQQLRQFELLSVDLSIAALSSQSYVAKVARMDADDALDVHYQQLLELVLRFVHDVSCRDPDSEARDKLLCRLYDLLDKVNSLLPGEQFLAVTGGLIRHPIVSVRHKAIEMLMNKLQHQPQFLSECEGSSLVGLAKPLVKISLSQEEAVVVCQSSLFCLKLMAQFLGKDYPKEFREVLQAVIKLLNKGLHPHLLSSALLCLSELCECLGAHVVPYLSRFVPPFMLIMEDLSLLQLNELLLQSVVVFVRCIVCKLPHFLSPYLHRLIKQTCLLCAKHTETSISEKLHSTCKSLASSVPPRVLLPALENCYDSLSLVEESHETAIEPLASILQLALEQMDKSDLNSHLPQLQAFILHALDFRNCHPQEQDALKSKVEDHIIGILLVLVLKLSENPFRSLFYQLYEWATRSEEHRVRTITFYRATDKIAEKLKSLFVPFAPYFVKNAADLLQQNNSSTTESLFFGSTPDGAHNSCILVSSILGTLHKCFLFDREHFVDRERFSTLLQPLVNQMENMVGGDAAYKERVSGVLAPCIAQFAVAAADDALWKQLHYQVLLKTRQSDVMVRFAALEVVCEMTRKLAEDYMVLLPEAIPFLAELMEDTCFEVEQRCQEVIAEMEQILGEPLSKYF